MIEPECDQQLGGNPADDPPNPLQRLVRWPDYTAVYANERMPDVIWYRRKEQPWAMGKVEPGLWGGFLDGSAPWTAVVDSLIERTPEAEAALGSIWGRGEPKPTVPEVLPLVRALYGRDGGGAGCCLHAVLDEPNFDDQTVAGCVEYARERGHRDCLELGLLLQRMSKTQRNKVATIGPNGRPRKASTGK